MILQHRIEHSWSRILAMMVMACILLAPAAGAVTLFYVDVQWQSDSELRVTTLTNDGRLTRADHDLGSEAPATVETRAIKGWDTLLKSRFLGMSNNDRFWWLGASKSGGTTINATHWDDGSGELVSEELHDFGEQIGPIHFMRESDIVVWKTRDYNSGAAQYEKLDGVSGQARVFAKAGKEYLNFPNYGEEIVLDGKNYAVFSERMAPEGSRDKARGRIVFIDIAAGRFFLVEEIDEPLVTNALAVHVNSGIVSFLTMGYSSKMYMVTKAPGKKPTHKRVFNMGGVIPGDTGFMGMESVGETLYVITGDERLVQISNPFDTATVKGLEIDEGPFHSFVGVSDLHNGLALRTQNDDLYIFDCTGEEAVRTHILRRDTEDMTYEVVREVE